MFDIVWRGSLGLYWIGRANGWQIPESQLAASDLIFFPVAK